MVPAVQFCEDSQDRKGYGSAEWVLASSVFLPSDTPLFSRMVTSSSGDWTSKEEWSGSPNLSICVSIYSSGSQPS